MSVVLATGSYDHKIRFFEAPSGVNSKTLRAGAPVNCLEITPNKQFIAAGCNPQIRLFEINDSSNANPDPVLTLEGHTAAVTSLGFQRDVRYLFSGSEDGTVKIFDLRGPNASCTFDCKAPVNSVVHHPSRPEIISGDQNGIIRVWDLGTSKCINELAPDAHDYPSQNGYGYGNVNTNASRHREESIGASTGTGTGTGTNTSTSTSKSKSYGQKASIQSVDISEDGRTFIAANNHAYVFMWDPSDSSNFVPITKFHAHPTGTYLLKAKISPDCRQLVTCSSDQSARIYDISRPRDRERERDQERDMHGGDGKSNSNRNGNGNGNSNDGNSHNSNNNNAHVNHNHSSSSSVNSNNSRNNTSNSATGSSINSSSCSSFAPKLIQSLTQHNKWVWDCVFSADSSYLVTASSDHSARLFNLRSGEVVRQYTGHQSAVTCVALNDSSS